MAVDEGTTAGEGVVAVGVGVAVALAVAVAVAVFWGGSGVASLGDADDA